MNAYGERKAQNFFLQQILCSDVKTMNLNSIGDKSMQERLNFAKSGFVALLLSVTAPMSLAASPAAELAEDSARSMVGVDLNEEHGATAESLDLRADTFIAVYYSPSKGNWGWGRSNDLELAKAIARGYCNDNSCQYIFWTQNACAVLATGSDFGYGWAWNSDRLAAVQNALQNCSNFSVSCKVVVNECT
jgi:hypothetical protein